jgi:tetratricopeptide (TPR) repeat protein
LRTLAFCLLNAGQPEAATAPLQTALRLDPHNGQLLISLIELCRSCGDLPQALDASIRLLALDSASAWDRLRHSELLHQCQRPREALACLDSLDAGDEQNLRAHGLQVRGLLLRQLGKPRESLTALREAVRLDPTCPDHAVELAGLLAEIGAFQEGLEGLEESERLIAGERGLHSQPWLQLAKLMLHRGAGDDETALAIAAGLTEHLQAGFHARVQRAELLMRLGDARAEAATMELAPVGADQERRALLSRSQWLKCCYRFDEAIAVLEPLLAAEPLDLPAADMA